MRRFAELYLALDGTTSTNAKLAAMTAYFREAAPDDAAWALFFLMARRIKRKVTTTKLKEWARALAGGMPEWLFEECHHEAGDLGETIALVLRPSDVGPPRESLTLAAWMTQRLLPLAVASEDEQRQRLTEWWAALDRTSLLVLNKILLGSLRLGVSHTLVTRALAEVAGVTPAVMAHRLSGDWEPSAAFYAGLMSGEAAPAAEEASKPYPFLLAYPLTEAPETLGAPEEYQIEWKWDGIRAQVIRRGGTTFVWSRGEDVVTERFPELSDAFAKLPDGTVLDGEILAWDAAAQKPRAFAALQRRIGRLKPSAATIAEFPVVFMAYDLLEGGGRDAREQPLRERRARMERAVAALATDVVMPSPRVIAHDWSALATLRDEARERRVEGFMLKRLDAPYAVGRRKGLWWKWKVDPYTIDAVLLYAQSGHGKRASLLTDYTFGVWQDGALVPIAKAYSGLDNTEIAELDKWIRAHTLQKFGPVRALPPEQVFELAFESLAPSSRHKSGVALRFPRIARWRKDKTPAEADTLGLVKELMNDAAH